LEDAEEQWYDAMKKIGKKHFEHHPEMAILNH